jgi:hypothetical protein
MKKYIFYILMSALTVVAAEQFVVPRAVKKTKKSAKKLQEECCQLAIDIQQALFSSYLHCLAELNELIVSTVTGCLCAQRESVFISSTKEQLEAKLEKLKSFKEKIIKDIEEAHNFITELKQ